MCITRRIGCGLHSVRGLVDESGALVEAADYDPYGIPDTALTDTDFAFTGEMRDANGLQYHRARYYAPSLGVFPSLDPFEGTMGRPMSLNGYSWVEGNPVIDAVGELLSLLNGYSYAGSNPVNRVDRNGMCWQNASASPHQQSQCYDAWIQYMDAMYEQNPDHWSYEFGILVKRERDYWESLSYNEFVSEWNGPRPPLQLTSGNNLQAVGTTMLIQGGTISQLDSPLLGIGDAVGIPQQILCYHSVKHLTLAHLFMNIVFLALLGE